MSMMVNPVSMSNVRFTAGEGTNVLERPGAFSKPVDNQAAALNDEVAAKPKKKNRAALLSLAGVVVAAATLAVLAKKNVVKTLNNVEFKEAKFMDKVSHYLAKAGEFIAKYTYDPVAKLCSKWFGGKKGEKVAEAASRIA